MNTTEAAGQDLAAIPQYSLVKTLLVWAAAALPMAVLGWVVAPALQPEPGRTGFERVAVLALGLIWQFALVLILVRQEAGDLRWSTIRQRLRLNGPRSPTTGRPRASLWWWIIPVVLLTGLYQTQLRHFVDQSWVGALPFLAQPAGLDFSGMMADPAARARLIGDWGALALFVVSAVFNTVLGEELLFRGLLPPRMAGAFGRWDWLANGLLFGLYHLHQPWGIAGSAVQGVLLFALPSRTFRSTWFGIIAHSGQSVFLAILILGLVLGLA